MDFQTQINHLANQLGVPLSPRDPRETYMWDTQSIGIGTLNYSNQLHELAHWQVATEEMRRELDFGLGAGPETGRAVSRRMSLAQSQTLEEEASLLGIAYEAYWGLPFNQTLELHEWHCLADATSFWATIQRLTDKGLLQGHLPTVR